MRWPFVTRSHFEEVVQLRDATICEQKARIEKLEAEVRVLHDEIAYRHSGRHLYQDLAPAPFVPANVTAEDADPMQQEVPSTVKEIQQKIGTKNRRATVRAIDSLLKRSYRDQIKKSAVYQQVVDEVEKTLEAKPQAQ